jgi:response regulator RpfG family c-di-GMP phosphodiesterase
MAAIATNQRVVDQLLADGRIQPAEHRQAVDYAVRNRGRIEDAIIDLGIQTEADLLKYVATMHRTRFVSTEKLSKAVVDARVMARVPRKLAELHTVCPVLYEEDAQRLSVVTPDPDNGAALDEVKLAAGVRSIRALVGRPAAVRALIARTYLGDVNAFVNLKRPVVVMPDIFDLAPFETTLPAHGGRPSPSSPPSAPSRPGYPSLVPEATEVSTVTSHSNLRAGSFAGPLPGAPAQPSFGPGVAAVVPSAPPAPPPPPPATSAEFLESLNVLITLLENGRAELRGHSSRVARLGRQVCERMSLGPLQSSAVVAACHLHDLGKVGTYHLTALNASEYEGHKLAAQKAFEMPERLMQSVRLVPETASALRAMYERYDGRGFPLGQSGKDIPLGGRILAVVDSFADVTQNPRNPFRRVLKPKDACVELAKHRGTIFDPVVLDILAQLMSGDDIRAKLFADRHVALLVDPDPEETTVLELRLVEQGFDVKIARTAAQARRELENADIDVVVSELDLEDPDAGLGLREWALREAKRRDVTWVVFARRGDRASAQKAFELGVDDFVSKPAAADVLAAKLRQLIERRAAPSRSRGAGGTLQEMSLPDVIQVLWHGRKTCALKVQSSFGAGEIHFHEGQVIDALWPGLRGDEAFYRLLTLHDGEFRIDLAFTPGPRAILASPESLLLEGMRRLDEAAHARR